MLNTQEFHRRFRSDDVCLQYLFDKRFSDVECPKCGRGNSFHRHSSKQCYTCNCGQHHIYPKKGTIFEGSPVPLPKWFYGVFLMSQKNGVSAKELERKLKVAYPTAWRMAKLIRESLSKKKESKARPSFDDYIALCCEKEPATKKKLMRKK